jgi:hypothetical protein
VGVFAMMLCCRSSRDRALIRLHTVSGHSSLPVAQQSNENGYWSILGVSWTLEVVVSVLLLLASCPK